MSVKSSVALLSYFTFVVIVKIIHQVLRQMKYAEANVGGMVEVQSWFLHVHCSQFICKNSEVVKEGEAVSFFSGFTSFTSLTFTRFLRFSIVFPKTELFISLKKSFSKSLAAFYAFRC